MKNEKYLRQASLVLAISCLMFLGCKKTTTNLVTTTNDSSSQTVTASDELVVNDEIDQAIDEAVSGLCICKPTSGSLTINHDSIPGAIIDTSQVDSGIVSIFYYGKEANPLKSRSGTVEIKLPVVSKHVIPWTTKGVIATITFTSYEIFYLNTVNTTLWFKGSFYVSNFSGGLLKNLVPGDSLIEKVKGPVSYTYNDNGAILQLYLWNLYRKRVLRTDTNVVNVTTWGDTIVNGFTNVSSWGQTRLSQTYYTSITTPVFQNISNSTYYNPLHGVKYIQGIPEPITATYGVNQQGTPMANGIPYGYLIKWTNSSGGGNVVISY